MVFGVFPLKLDDMPLDESERQLARWPVFAGLDLLFVNGRVALSRGNSCQPARMRGWASDDVDQEGNALRRFL